MSTQWLTQISTDFNFLNQDAKRTLKSAVEKEREEKRKERKIYSTKILRQQTREGDFANTSSSWGGGAASEQIVNGEVLPIVLEDIEFENVGENVVSGEDITIVTKLEEGEIWVVEHVA